MMWLLNVDPAVVERERFRTTDALLSEAPGDAVDRERQKRLDKERFAARDRERDAHRREEIAAEKRHWEALVREYKARRDAGPSSYREAA